jgi:hypothetical protein
MLVGNKAQLLGIFPGTTTRRPWTEIGVDHDVSLEKHVTGRSVHANTWISQKVTIALLLNVELRRESELTPLRTLSYISEEGSAVDVWAARA